MEAIAKRGRIIVGVDQNSYLVGFRDSVTGQLAGFDIDIAREFARAIFGNPDAIHFKTMNAAARIPAIQHGDVDIIVRQTVITCERLQQVAFSTEYVAGGQRLLVERGSGFRGIDDLGGKRVCAAKTSTNLRVIQQATSHPITVGVDSLSDCMVMLQQNQIEAISSDNILLAGLAAQDPTTEIVGPRLTDDPWGVAMSKESPELVRFVNAVLERMRSDGTWAAIYTRWLGILGPTPAPPRAQYRD